MMRIYRTITVIAIGLMILANGCLEKDISKATDIPRATDIPKDKEIKIIDSSAIKLTVKQSGYCKALAPQDWSIIANQDGSGMDLWSPNGNMHTGWSIAFFYYDMFPTEERLFEFYMPAAGYPNYKLSSPYDMGYGFTKRNLTTNNKKGYLFYRKYDSPELGGYVMSIYMADTDINIWESKGYIPSLSAISIRCITQLRPPQNGDGNNGISSSSDSDEISMSDKWQEAIMGFENVYSPSIGEHYQVPLNSYWKTGPEGPGYYRSLPDGGYEKLNRGFGDY